MRGDKHFRRTLLLGLGIGLLLSLILPGGFLRVVVGLVLIALGYLLSNCC